LLANSIAPGIIGGREVDIETPWGETYDKYWWIRLATGIANLFSGWRRPNGDGTYHRGNSHVAMIGDPSTGKSTIMGAVEEIAPRSAAESGRNASGPGLTAAAVKDDFGDSQWSLEAGALVKAHNGVACIDEIDKMQKDGLSRLHSALEKQRLEINKAGIDATLKCETSLLAAGNPKDSRFDTYDADHEQIDIVGSLMDRFDLIFTLKDRPDEEKDRQMAESKIAQRAESGLVQTGMMEQTERETATPEMDTEQLQAWVAYARQQFQPVLRDEDVKERLRDYYVEIRQANGSGEDEPVPATVRTLDGLLRLSEASARMRLSEEIEPIDAEMAIALVKISLQDVGYDPETGKMDADFAAGRGSQSQRDRVKRLLGIVETLESGESAPTRKEIINAASEAGIDKDKADKEIDQLKQKGELYTPQKGHLRTT
jgi:replicative DNA helicase Mcm